MYIFQIERKVAFRDFILNVTLLVERFKAAKLNPHLSPQFGGDYSLCEVCHSI